MWVSKCTVASCKMKNKWWKIEFFISNNKREQINVLELVVVVLAVEVVTVNLVCYAQRIYHTSTEGLLSTNQ